MIRWLRRLLDPPDRDYLPQMRSLWRVPPDWQHRTTAKVLPRKLTVVKKDAKRTA